MSQYPEALCETDATPGPALFRAGPGGRAGQGR